MLNTAIIGMGGWGRTLVNAVQGKQGSNIRFVAGTTGTLEKARDYASKHKITLHPSYAAVLADPAVQAVVLASPHGIHAEQVIAAAAAGKHVFVEKPFTLSRASAEAAVAACARAGVVMALGHNRRFLPAVAEMKAMLADGRIGTLLHVEGHISGPGAAGYKAGMWRADRQESPLGGMGGMGIHVIDLIIHLAGRFRDVRVLSHAAVSTTIDDTTAMLATLESGATVTFATLALAPRMLRVALFGTAGWVALHGPEHLTYCALNGTPTERVFPNTDIERAELEAFATAVAGGPAYPLPTDEAIHGVSVFETMIGAAASGSAYAVG